MPQRKLALWARWLQEAGMADPASEIIEGDESGDLPPARPAATLIVFADGAPGEPPVLLMVKRSTSMAFAGGAVVFPGGRVDPDDHALAAANAGPNDDRDDLAGRIAAIRETLEETGLLVNGSGMLGPHVAQSLRRDLAAGVPFSECLERHAITLDLTALTPFARWIPKFKNPRRFDTRFFIARLPAGLAMDSLSVDATENSALFWAGALETLAMAAAGDVDIIFPTRRNLERLGQYASFAEAADCAARHPPTIISPWVERRGDSRFLVIPSGIGYPVTEECLDTVTRG
jgi:8-oxo-dGTP pyrophosphatase MutT (NUDIX family)